MSRRNIRGVSPQPPKPEPTCFVSGPPPEGVIAHSADAETLRTVVLDAARASGLVVNEASLTAAVEFLDGPVSVIADPSHTHSHSLAAVDDFMGGPFTVPVLSNGLTMFEDGSPLDARLENPDEELRRPHAVSATDLARPLTDGTVCNWSPEAGIVVSSVYSMPAGRWINHVALVGEYLVPPPWRTPGSGQTFAQPSTDQRSTGHALNIGLRALATIRLNSEDGIRSINQAMFDLILRIVWPTDYNSLCSITVASAMSRTADRLRMPRIQPREFLDEDALMGRIVEYFLARMDEPNGWQSL